MSAQNPLPLSLNLMQEQDKVAQWSVSEFSLSYTHALTVGKSIIYYPRNIGVQIVAVTSMSYKAEEIDQMYVRITRL